MSSDKIWQLVYTFFVVSITTSVNRLNQWWVPSIPTISSRVQTWIASKTSSIWETMLRPNRPKIIKSRLSCLSLGRRSRTCTEALVFCTIGWPQRISSTRICWRTSRRPIAGSPTALSPADRFWSTARPECPEVQPLSARISWNATDCQPKRRSIASDRKDRSFDLTMDS